MRIPLARHALVPLILLSTAVVRGEQENPRPQDRREPGVRCRLYWIGRPVADHAELAPDQSPNLDVTIPALAVRGDEPWFTAAGRRYEDDYVLRLDGRLKIDTAGDYRFRLDGGLVRVFINERSVVDSGGKTGRSAPRKTALGKGVHRLRVVQTVSGGPRGWKLQWKRPGEAQFRPIPPTALTAEAFYFRPTNGGKKRLVDTRDRPGKRQKVAGLHPGMDLATIRPQGAEVPVGGLDVLSDGRLVVATFDARRLHAPRPQETPDGELWLYRNPAAKDRQKIQRERIAEALYEPGGVCVVGDSIYVSQRSEVTRFDYDAKSHRWKATPVAAGWVTNDFHAISFGLIHQPGEGDHPGYLYMARGTGLGLRQNPPDHGSVWKIDLAGAVGSNVEPITGGHRTPNGIGLGPGGAIFVTDNQGEYTPANELNHVQEGRFYGFYQRVGPDGFPSPFQDEADRLNPDGAVTEAAVILPQDEIANSPSEPVLIPDKWPFAGQMLVGDVKYGGINRIYLEQVEGVWQGAALRFTQGLEAGINRITFAPDGSLYAGGIGGDHATTWNWVDPQGRKTYQGLQRLTPNGKTVFEIEKVSARPGGFAISLTKAVDRVWLSDPGHFLVEQWTYEATPRYGGPKMHREQLEVKSAEVSADGKTVNLVIDGLRQGYVIYFLVDPTSVDGQRIWSAEAWYTLNRIPRE